MELILPTKHFHSHYLTIPSMVSNNQDASFSSRVIKNSQHIIRSQITIRVMWFRKEMNPTTRVWIIKGNYYILERLGRSKPGRDAFANQFDLRGGLPTAVTPPFPERIESREKRRRGMGDENDRGSSSLATAGANDARAEACGGILFNSGVSISLLLTSWPFANHDTYTLHRPASERYWNLRNTKWIIYYAFLYSFIYIYIKTQFKIYLFIFTFELNSLRYHEYLVQIYLFEIFYIFKFID